MEYEDIRARISEVVDFEIENVRPLGSGMGSTAYVVNDEWVFRFPQTKEAELTLVKEAKVLPVLEPALPVGIPVFSYVQATEDAPAFAGYELLPGEAMTRERFGGLDPGVQEQLLGEMYGFLESLHAVAIGKVPELREEPLVGAYNAGQRQFHERLKDVLTAEEVQKIEKIFQVYESDPANRPEKPSVIHADLKPDHVLFDEVRGHLSGVLDWGDSCLGDPDYDFAVIGVFFGDEFLQRLLGLAEKADRERIAGKVPFLVLVRALQDLVIDVAAHDEALVTAGLRHLRKQLEKF